jgi:hypothetical protein
MGDACRLEFGCDICLKDVREPPKTELLKYFNSQALGGGLSRDFIKNRTEAGFSPVFSRQEERS